MALPKLYRAFNMKINCSSDIDFCHAKSFAWFVMRKMNKKCFLLLLLQILTSKWCIEWPKVLHMWFARFLLAFESRDLSQADKSIIRVSSFPNWVMSSGTSFSVSQAWGLNFLQNEFCQSSQIYLSPEKTEKTVYFLSLETFEWWIEQNNFPKLPNSFFV